MSLCLTNRLQTAAALVRSGRLTADVGTDHGYLPAFLVISGKTDRAIASDIGKGPLENAAKTVKKYGLEKNIRLLLSDGLQHIPHETEEIILTGMGGTLMADILSAADWIQKESIHLVLQPMTHFQDVRRFLCENGFWIDTEQTCADCGKVYLVMSAYFCGRKEKKDAFYYYFGDRILPESDTDKAYIKKQIQYIHSRYEGLKKTDNRTETAFFYELLTQIEQRKEWKSL